MARFASQGVRPRHRPGLTNMKPKTPKEIRQMLLGSVKNLREGEARAAQAKTQLRPEVKAYREGALWALEWALGKRG